MLLILAAALPSLFWDGGPEIASKLKDAGIGRISVPASRAESWKNISGIRADPVDLQGSVKLPTPSVDYRVDQASASRVPWLNSNGWRFLRQPAARFYYDAPGTSAALAAAEAFSFGASVVIRTDADGIQPLGAMLTFLAGLPDAQGNPIADFAVIDDGSPAAGEALNLLVRNNLLFKIVSAPDPQLKLTVRLAAKDVQDPRVVVQTVRRDLTDEKRSVRVYGSSVVLARVTGDASRVRVHLLNYAAVTRSVQGIRVRILGRYTQHAAPLLDYTVDAKATEFTVPELGIYTAIDLKR